MESGEEELDDAKAGDEPWDSNGGRLEGSRSRSGMGGDTRGLRVILRRVIRRTALDIRYIICMP